MTTSQKDVAHSLYQQAADLKYTARCTTPPMVIAPVCACVQAAQFQGVLL